MIEILRVPKGRLPIVIGKDGKIKAGIEKLTDTKISVNDDVTIEGEALAVLAAKNIIRAIGRGFSPENASKLADENKTIYVISLDEKRNALIRIKSRLIGTGGKAKRNIESLTDTKISIYGKTISIIGDYEDIDRAREAIGKLISGSPHGNVYKFLEKR